jgi:DNA ligase-1
MSDCQSAAPGDGDRKEARASDVQPLNPMTEGDAVKFPSSSSTSVYEVRLRGGVYYCSCPAWRNQKHSVNMRSCKHLLEHLGAAFEAQRCPHIAKPGAPPSKSKSKPKPAPKTKSKAAKRKQPETTTADAKKRKPHTEALEEQEKEMEDGPMGKRKMAVLLAEKWSPDVDPKGWWLSEKLDGDLRSPKFAGAIR